MRVELIEATNPDVMLRVMSICRGKTCTQDTMVEALEAKPVPHASLLEFGWVCLLVEGVSVKTRIQLLRSRLFSTMERSTRSIDMTNAGIVVPTTSKTKGTMRKTMDSEMDDYSVAVINGETFEDASYLLPLGVETDFFLAGNLRVWFEYFQKRLCKKHVQDEHYRMAMRMFTTILGVFPTIAKAHPCKACGACERQN